MKHLFHDASGWRRILTEPWMKTYDLEYTPESWFDEPDPSPPCAARCAVTSWADSPSRGSSRRGSGTCSNPC